VKKLALTVALAKFVAAFTLATGVVAGLALHPVTTSSPRPTCPAVLTLGAAELPSCDPTTVHELNVTGVDQMGCDHLGGQFADATCWDVDH
jgi:hypothetical protein